MSKYVLGADIGGSHITAAVVDMDSRKIIEESRVRRKIDSFNEASDLIKDWTSVINKSFKKCNIQLDKIGMALPGPFNYDEGISLLKDNNKYSKLFGLNVKNLLAESLNIKSASILMNNDALCFLAGEKFSGVVKKYDKILGVTLGTGLGSSIYSEGLIEDADLWHSPFKNGIAEDYISSRWFLKRYYEISGIHILNVKDLALKYESSDEVKQVFEEFANNLGEFLIGLLDSFKFNAIVLGGNISKASPYFYNTLQNLVNKSGLEIDILISDLNEDATILGAASLWSNK